MTKNNLFPIVEAENHKIISIDSNIGYFYRVDHQDLEQLDYRELGNFFSGLSMSLNQLPTNCYYKLYWIDRKAYLETDATEIPEFAGLELAPCGDHLKFFFKTDNFLSDVKIYEDYMVLPNRRLKLISVTSFSESPIFYDSLPLNYDYVLKMRRIDHDKATKKLDGIRKRHQASFLKSRTDHVSHGAYEEAEGLMSDLVHGDECLFETELTFIVDDEFTENLQMNVDNLVKDLRFCGVDIYQEGASASKGKSGFLSVFNELIPGVKPSFSSRVMINKTSHLQNLIPLRDSYLCKSGVMFADRNYNRVKFNPFEPRFQNRNMLVTGTSGTGKSVFVNTLVDKLCDKHPTVILDKGGSFKLLTLYHEGHELIGKINPMQFRDAAFLREFILSVVDVDKFDKLEQGRLLKEIKAFLSTDKISFCDLLDYLENSFNDITLYFEGITEFLTDDVIEDYPILYVDVNNFSKNMISPIILFILQYFKEYPASEKILVFDECWSFLTNHSDYIDECFRTFRKTGAFPIAISQGIDDFKQMGDKLSHSITNNSYFKVFFPQELKSDQDVSEFDIEKIKSLEFQKESFSDCYLKSSDEKIKKVLRNILSTRELELFNTEYGRSHRLQLFLKDNSKYFKNNREAIDAFIGLQNDKIKSLLGNDNSYVLAGQWLDVLYS
jgi:hypothetical protein